MNTKKVKAVDMLDAKTPFLFKGRAGLYAVTRTATDHSRVRFFAVGMCGKESLVASRHLNDDVEILVEDVNQNADHLLDTIGALHTRNKGLQKGHATLTRRVQELEAELALTKQQLLSASGTSFTVAGGQVFINEALFNAPVPAGKISDRAVDAIIADVLKSTEHHLDKLDPAPTAADQRLADDIYSLRRRIACNLHEWEQQAVQVLSRLADEERRNRLANARRRGE